MTSDRWGHVWEEMTPEQKQKRIDEIESRDDVQTKKHTSPLRALVYVVAFVFFAVFSVIVTVTIGGELVAMLQASDPEKAFDSFMIAFVSFLFGGGALVAIWN